MAAPALASRTVPSRIRVGRFTSPPSQRFQSWSLVVVLVLILIHVDKSHRVRLGGTRSSAIRPVVGLRSVHRDARPTGQFVPECGIEDQLAGLRQPGHAHPIVACLVKAGQVERCQLHEIVRRGDPAGLVVEHHQVRPAVSGEVLPRIQVERSGDRGTILGAIVASGDAPDNPVFIGLDGRCAAFDESPGSQ